MTGTMLPVQTLSLILTEVVAKTQDREAALQKLGIHLTATHVASVIEEVLREWAQAWEAAHGH